MLRASVLDFAHQVLEYCSRIFSGYSRNVAEDQNVVYSTVTVGQLQRFRKFSDHQQQSYCKRQNAATVYLMCKVHG